MVAPLEEHVEYLLPICERHYPEDRKPYDGDEMCGICGLPAKFTVTVRSYQFGTVDPKKMEERGMTGTVVPDTPVSESPETGTVESKATEG